MYGRFFLVLTNMVFDLVYDGLSYMLNHSLNLKLTQYAFECETRVIFRLHCYYVQKQREKQKRKIKPIFVNSCDFFL